METNENPHRAARMRARTMTVFLRGAGHGLVSGAAGVAVMTLGEKLEQRITGRPDSHVPGRTMTRLLPTTKSPASVNLFMHFGQGALLGMLRGVMADSGLRGPWSSAMFAVVRLTNDQTLENASGVGAPPWTWPRTELLVDLAHKSVYALATGFVADKLAERIGPGPGLQHARLRWGRHTDIGPVEPKAAGGGGGRQH
ncbi:hypothetical protein FHX42_003372 [Saccharopolyspora lacisalsi]|uniref:DUF1440 domain-containing protein n=2 Tax=Halosaccharopolyspora lacisalsi TaxID=1000566 RepID=A0A839E0F8_9PSEU|nr:hypothetical protein [Halosaccharopolyspora lacisalsi]